MSVIAWAKFALLLLQAFNWVAGKIHDMQLVDRTTRDLLQKELDAHNARVVAWKQAIEDINKLDDDAVTARLREHKALRD